MRKRHDVCVSGMGLPLGVINPSSHKMAFKDFSYTL